MKSVDLPDDIADILEPVPASGRGEFLRQHGFIPSSGKGEARRVFHLFTDGASRGNPGEAAAGFVIEDVSGKILLEGKTYLGMMTNNMAEWNALLLGLKKAQELGIQQISCFLDSELVIRQMNGEYKVKNQDLRPVFEESRILASGFREISFTHVKRQQNALADRLANEAIDEHQHPTGET